MRLTDHGRGWSWISGVWGVYKGRSVLVMDSPWELLYRPPSDRLRAPDFLIQASLDNESTWTRL